MSRNKLMKASLGDACLRSIQKTLFQVVKADSGAGLRRAIMVSHRRRRHQQALKTKDAESPERISQHSGQYSRKADQRLSHARAAKHETCPRLHESPSASSERKHRAILHPSTFL